MPQDELLKQGIRTLLDRRLREVKSEISEIAGQLQASQSANKEIYPYERLSSADAGRGKSLYLSVVNEQ